MFFFFWGGVWGLAEPIQTKREFDMGLPQTRAPPPKTNVVFSLDLLSTQKPRPAKQDTVSTRVSLSFSPHRTPEACCEAQSRAQAEHCRNRPQKTKRTRNLPEVTKNLSKSKGPGSGSQGTALRKSTRSFLAAVRSFIQLCSTARLILGGRPGHGRVPHPGFCRAVPWLGGRWLRNFLKLEPAGLTLNPKGT